MSCAPHVLIIGGGVMGSAVACFLSRDHGARVTVLERDPSYARASSALSASSIRQQFSQPVNMALSAWSWQFLQDARAELAVGDVAPDLNLHEGGYLYLAQQPEQAAALRAVHALQRAHGVDAALLEPAQLRQRWPWLRTDDLQLGSLGLRREGWFDGPGLHLALRRKAQACGARFVTAEAVQIETRGARVLGVLDAQGQRHALDQLVLAAGAWSRPLGLQLGWDLPVHARKRDVFFFDSPQATPRCPLVIDPCGVWFRPEGRGYLVGAAPRHGDPDEPPLHAIDHAAFEEQLWPALAQRVPGFEQARVRSAWAGYYEMNLFDHNGLAGALPDWANAHVACGFSGHGMQQAPAVGCALAAGIAGRPSTAPALDALSPQRLRLGQALLEANVIG